MRWYGVKQLSDRDAVYLQGAAVQSLFDRI